MFVVGMVYKKDVNDMCELLVLMVCEGFLVKGYELMYYDFYIDFVILNK